MLNKNKTINKKYWEENIKGFAGFYDKQSEEALHAPNWLSGLYKQLIFPVEKKYMLKRFNIVSDYIDAHVHSGMTVADIGCGSGIFSRRIIQQSARVYAIDYTESALNLVRKTLTQQEMCSVELMNMDITVEALPPVDLAIAIGVLTYIDNVEQFFDHILPNTKKLLFNFIDADHVLNRLRQLFTVLDVRRLSYHSLNAVQLMLKHRNFNITCITKLATGYVVAVEKGGS